MRYYEREYRNDTWVRVNSEHFFFFDWDLNPEQIDGATFTIANINIIFNYKRFRTVLYYLHNYTLQKYFCISSTVFYYC